MKIINLVCYAFISASITLGQFACTEKEEIPSFPPQPGVEYATLLVGSGIDSLPLEATALNVEGYYNTKIASTWETEWTCVQAPDGAALPSIHRANSLSAMATGLKEGSYIFSVKFSTKHGYKSAVMEIEVIPDIPMGKQVTLTDLEWSVESIGAGTANPSNLAHTYLYHRPDLIFYRGFSRFPKVEYQDPQSGQWITVNKSPANNGCAFGCITEGAVFNVVEYNLDITLIKGISADWLKNAKTNPAVRLTY